MRLEEGKVWPIPVISCATASFLLVGHLQHSALVLLICGLAALWKSEARFLKVASLTFGVMMALPHLVPFIELLSLSNRGGDNMELTAQNLLAPREYLQFLFPFLNGAPTDFFYLGRNLAIPVVNGREHTVYIGMLTFLLALFSVTRLKSRFEKVMLGVMLIGLATAGSAFLYSTMTLIFPPLVKVTPLRYLSVIHFGTCYLAAKAWVSLPESPTVKDLKFPLGLAGVGLILVSTFVIPATFRPQQFAYWLFSLVEGKGLTRPPYFEGDYGTFAMTKMTEHFWPSSVAIWLPVVLLAGFIFALTRKDEKQRFYLCLGITLVDLLFYFFSLNIPTPEARFYPMNKEMAALKVGHELKVEEGRLPTRILALGRGIHPNIPLAYGISNFEAYESVLPGCTVRSSFI